MPGRENLVSSFNWTCHANGAVGLKGTAALTGAPHSRTARKILLLFHVPLDCLSGLCRPNWDKGNSNRLLYCWLSVNLPVKSLNGFSSPDRCAFLQTRLKLSHQLSVSLTAPNTLLSSTTAKPEENCVTWTKIKEFAKATCVIFI